ncbi:MAG: hypothetical protein V5B34_06800 [Accumulibacter sp.]|jgi:hypothetical protein|uniref:hypothetical protein n=1 Tax=Accumulibacter sp. TaxID=2053492 RepID=UPI002FC3173A
MGEDEAQAQPVPEYEFDQRIACQVPMRKGPDCSMMNCHRPSWEDSCLLRLIIKHPELSQELAEA